MRRWCAEYDDGIWRFYRDGIELPFSVKGDIVVDALNKAEARIAELKAFINQLIEAGDGLVGDCELNWKHNHIPDCPPANHWQALVDDWKER